MTYDMAMAPKKPHVVCLPAPGHISPMMTLAQVLHSRGFYITMVLTDFDAARLATSLAAESPTLQRLHHFCFETIPDGLPPDNKRAVSDLPKLALSRGQPKEAFRTLLLRLLASSTNNIPPISSIISDANMFFAHDVANELGIQTLFFQTTSACGMLGYLLFDDLVQRDLFPLKDESCLMNGFLDTPIDWVPGLTKGATLKDLPTFIRTTDRNDTMFNYLAEAARRCSMVDGVILNTFYELEANVLEEIKTRIRIPNNLYIIGPLSLLRQQVMKGQEFLPMKSNFWAEDSNCLEWLDKRSPKSVIYVNYGSFAILTPQQLEEFAWGLANSKHSFLWVIRPDLVEGQSSVITDVYMEEIKGRGLITSWCSQEKVLRHPSVAVFFTHCSWNSTLESMIEEVPIICWPIFSEQLMNSLYSCREWGIGMEMEEGNARREKIEELVRKMMEGEKGKELRKKVMEWKLKAKEATRIGGSSHTHFEKLVKYLM